MKPDTLTSPIDTLVHRVNQPGKLMAISFLAFICMTVTGAAVVSMLGRRFNAQLNLALALGAGFSQPRQQLAFGGVTPLPLTCESPAVGVVVTITLLVLARADPLALKEDIRHAIAHFGHSKISFFWWLLPRAISC